jgi:hypothetical protein
MAAISPQSAQGAAGARRMINDLAQFYNGLRLMAQNRGPEAALQRLRWAEQWLTSRQGVAALNGTHRGDNDHSSN